MQIILIKDTVYKSKLFLEFVTEQIWHDTELKEDTMISLQLWVKLVNGKNICLKYSTDVSYKYIYECFQR